MPNTPQDDPALRRERLDHLNTHSEALDLGDRLRLLRAAIPGRLCLTTSFGIEDQLLTAVAARLPGTAQGPAVELVTLDTGRLFPETLDVWQQTEAHTGRTIRAVRPTPASVADLVARDGEHGFYDSVEQRHACCAVRKTAPLAHMLDGVALWLTGLRAEQSPSRAAVPFLEWDDDRGLLKANPLHDWTRQAVLDALAACGMPVSALEARGYRSVGCEPCTRATRAGEPERAGRWWWEQDGSARECGLHRSPHLAGAA